MNRAARRRQERERAKLVALFAQDPTHGGVVPWECRGTPEPGKIDQYDADKRRLFNIADVSRFWVSDTVLRLTHLPTGVSAEGEGPDEREALRLAGVSLEARLVFVRREKEVGFDARQHAPS